MHEREEAHARTELSRNEKKNGTQGRWSSRAATPNTVSMRGTRQNTTTHGHKGGQKSKLAGVARVRKKHTKSAVEVLWPLAGQGVCWSRRRLVGLENAAQGGGKNVQWDDDSNTRPNLENEGNRAGCATRLGTD